MDRGVIFHFEKPSGFAFKAGQSADVTLINPPDTDAEGNPRTFSIGRAVWRSFAPLAS
jgi:hypothetical protein